MSGRQDVKVHVLRLPDGLERWHLVAAYFRLRKAVFVDELRWDLYAQNLAEFEQYDHLGATYVIAEDSRSGEVLGGARLLPTAGQGSIYTGRVQYSYMIRDAGRGLLDGLTVDLSLREAPVDPTVWELTRLVSKGSSLVARAVLRAAKAHLIALGATSCLFLGPPSFMRLARMMGSAPQPMGKVTRNGSGAYLAFACSLVGTMPGFASPSIERASHGRTPPPGLNIGVVKQLHLAPDRRIVGTTYEWSGTGEQVTVWHEPASGMACRTLDLGQCHRG